MFKKNSNIHFRIINFWLFFVLFLIILSNLPHAPAPIFSWVNCSIYFLLFLQSFYLVKQDPHNKFIFFNIGLLALVHSLSFVSAFLGEQGLFGSQYLEYYFFTYLRIIQSFFFVFCIIYLCINYLFKDSSVAFIYGLTCAVVLPIFLWHYYPFLVHKEYLLEIEETRIEKSILYTNFLPLFFVFLYGIILYKYDRSLGEHINTIMVCFFIMIIMDITNLLGSIYHITIFSLTQYVLSITLAFFIGTLFRLLNYVYSAFGQFYDSIVISGNHLGVPIKRRKSASLPIIDFARAYFHQRRNAIGFLTLLFIFCFNYFQVSLFIKLDLAVLSFGLLLLFYYLTALYQKRSRNGDLLSLRSNRI